MNAATEIRSTFEFTINAGPGMRVHLDSYAGGAPYLIISDGSTEVTIRPPDDDRDTRGTVKVRGSKSRATLLTFTVAEWHAFILGAKRHGST